jgi:hypothetical protein
LRLRIQGREFKDREWAGQDEIIKVAQKFGFVIAIVDTRYPANKFVYHYINQAGAYDHTNNPALLPKGQAIIQLAFTGDHYLSVTSVPKRAHASHQAAAERGFLSPKQRSTSRGADIVIDEKNAEFRS